MIGKSEKKEEKDELAQYTFEGEKRPKIPLAGLVSDKTNSLNENKTCMFDPHRDPELQWTKKAENPSYTIISRKW